MLIIAPTIGTRATHFRLHAPFVHGISLDHVSKEGFSWIRGIAHAEVVDEEQAISLLADLIGKAKAVLETKLQGLNGALTETNENYSEAERLAATPVVGNEASIVTGYIAMLDSSLAEAARLSDDRIISDTKFLQNALPDVRAFRTTPLTAALQDFEKQEKKIGQVELQLSNVREKLRKLLDRIDNADRRELLQKVQVNVALVRAVPKALEELQALRASSIAVAERCERAIRTLHQAVELPHAAK